MRKNGKIWLVILVALAVGLLLFRSSRKQSEKQPAANKTVSENTSNSPATKPPAPAFASNTVAAPAPDTLASHAASPNPTREAGAATNEEPALPPAVALDKARIVVRNYRSAFGEDPVGTNPEITAALMGKNTKGINFVAGTGLSVDANGNMVDGYGVPFFFHQISGQEMEIRSAGPDHVMWTADDLVTR